MLDTILRIIALTRKELLAVLKDRRARMSLLIPPIVQGLIFGYAATYDLNHVPYAVLDQDRSAASRELLAGLDGSGVFERVADLRSSQDIRTYIDQRRALLGDPDRAEFRAQTATGSGDGRAGHCRRPQFKHGRHGVELRHRGRGHFNDQWRTDHGLPAAGPDLDRPGLVQPESRDPLEHDPRVDRHAGDDTDADAHRHVGCPGA